MAQRSSVQVQRLSTFKIWLGLRFTRNSQGGESVSSGGEHQLRIDLGRFTCTVPLSMGSKRVYNQCGARFQVVFLLTVHDLGLGMHLSTQRLTAHEVSLSGDET